MKDVRWSLPSLPCLKSLSTVGAAIKDLDTAGTTPCSSASAPLEAVAKKGVSGSVKVIVMFSQGFALVHDMYIAVEIGVTASAIPVQLECRPKKLTFGACPVGHSVLQSLQLVNTSDSLPLQFHCQLPAHFKMSVARGHINPGQSLELEVAFQPRQLGPLSGKLSVGVTTQTRDGPMTIHSTSIDLSATGATPMVTKTRKKKTILAKLDDLSQSIRPADRTLDVRY